MEIEREEHYPSVLFIEFINTKLQALESLIHLQITQVPTIKISQRSLQISQLSLQIPQLSC